MHIHPPWPQLFRSTASGDSYYYPLQRWTIFLTVDNYRIMISLVLLWEPSWQMIVYLRAKQEVTCMAAAFSDSAEIFHGPSWESKKFRRDSWPRKPQHGEESRDAISYFLHGLMQEVAWSRKIPENNFHSYLCCFDCSDYRPESIAAAQVLLTQCDVNAFGKYLAKPFGKKCIQFKPLQASDGTFSAIRFFNSSPPKWCLNVSLVC